MTRRFTASRISHRHPGEADLLFHRRDHRQVRDDAALSAVGRSLGRPEVVIEGVDLQAPRRAARLSPGGRADQVRPALARRAGHDAQDRPAHRRPGYVRLPRSVRRSCATRCPPSPSSTAGWKATPRIPFSAGLSLDAMVGEGYFARTGGEILCFGAGGSAVATALHLINKTRPRRPARSASSWSTARRGGWTACERWSTSWAPTSNSSTSATRIRRATMRSWPRCRRAASSSTPPAWARTRPGSPITDAGVFPCSGIAWEFNYRGELDFLHQALAQEDARQLHVEDGWVYFLHGWTQVIAQVFHITLDDALFARLAASPRRIR